MGGWTTIVEVIVVISFSVDVVEVELSLKVVLFDVVVSFDVVLSFGGEASLMTCFIAAFDPKFVRQPSSRYPLFPLANDNNFTLE